MVHSFVSFVPLAPPFSLMNYLNHMSSSQWQRMTRGYHWSNIKLSIPRNSMNTPSSKSQSSPRINKKRCFLAPNLDTTWHKSLDCGRCISKMYELKAPLTLGALEFYLGPGYTEWELKEDTWRNSWKTWDFGMWKNTTPWCMSFFYCIFWLSQALVLGVLGVLGGLETAVTSDQQKWPEVKSGPPSSSCSRPRKMGPWKAIFSCPMSAMSHLFAH